MQLSCNSEDLMDTTGPTLWYMDFYINRSGHRRIHRSYGNGTPIDAKEWSVCAFQFLPFDLRKKASKHQGNTVLALALTKNSSILIQSFHRAQTRHALALPLMSSPPKPCQVVHCKHLLLSDGEDAPLCLYFNLNSICALLSNFFLH